MASGPRDERASLEILEALHEEGVALMRQALRRRHPVETEAEIDERLRRWLQDLEARDVGPCLEARPWPRTGPRRSP